MSNLATDDYLLLRQKELVMKKTLIALVGVAAVALPLGAAQAASTASEAALQSLNNTHAQIVRGAERVCAGINSGSTVSNVGGGCTLGDVERQIRSTDNPELLAFHQQLPPRFRYSSDRSYSEVQRYFR